MVYIPKQQILTRFKRYKNLNESRLQHALAVMNNDSRFILSIVPVLLHYNHINLPGFRSGNIPCGIDLFIPNDQQRQYLNSLITDQSPPLQEPQERSILGLYAMGSTSSLGQSDSSDLDIWVCVKAKLDEQSRHALQDKCRFISNYVKSQGVELNLFVTPEDRFTNFQPDSLDEENCGSAQNLFLLDEFYRTSIRLCGRYIIWYLISNREEYFAYDKYVDFLLKGQTNLPNPNQGDLTNEEVVLKSADALVEKNLSELALANAQALEKIKNSESLNQEAIASDQSLSLAHKLAYGSDIKPKSNLQSKSLANALSKIQNKVTLLGADQSQETNLNSKSTLDPKPSYQSIEQAQDNALGLAVYDKTSDAYVQSGATFTKTASVSGTNLSKNRTNLKASFSSQEYYQSVLAPNLKPNDQVNGSILNRKLNPVFDDQLNVYKKPEELDPYFSKLGVNLEHLHKTPFMPAYELNYGGSNPYAIEAKSDSNLKTLNSSKAIRTLYSVKNGSNKRTLKEKLGYQDFSNNAHVIALEQSTGDLTTDEIREIEIKNNANYNYQNLDLAKENITQLDRSNVESELEVVLNHDNALFNEDLYLEPNSKGQQDLSEPFAQEPNAQEGQDVANLSESELQADGQLDRQSVYQSDKHVQGTQNSSNLETDKAELSSNQELDLVLNDFENNPELLNNALDEDLAIDPKAKDYVESNQVFYTSTEQGERRDFQSNSNQSLLYRQNSEHLFYEHLDRDLELANAQIKKNLALSNTVQSQALDIQQDLMEHPKTSFMTLANIKKRTINLLFPSLGTEEHEIEVKDQLEQNSQLKESNPMSRVNNFAAAMGVVQMPFINNNYPSDLELIEERKNHLFDDPYTDQDFINIEGQEHKLNLGFNQSSGSQVHGHYVIKRTKTKTNDQKAVSDYKQEQVPEVDQLEQTSYSREKHLINVLSFGSNLTLEHNPHLQSPITTTTQSAYIKSFHDSRVPLARGFVNKTEDVSEKSSYSFIHNDTKALSEEDLSNLNAKDKVDPSLNASLEQNQALATQEYVNERDLYPGKDSVEALNLDPSLQIEARPDNLSASDLINQDQSKNTNDQSSTLAKVMVQHNLSAFNLAKVPTSDESKNILEQERLDLDRYLYSGFGRVLTNQECIYMARQDCFEEGDLPLNPDEWFDFGSITHSSPNEYFGSGLWLLYKAIDSPFKVVLKILLMEAYANDYPHTNLLCSELKDYMLSHDGYSIDLDAYYLMYLKVSHYLQNHFQDQRLTLMRKCFYLKIFLGLNTSCPYNTTDYKLKRKLLTKFHQRWGWSDKFVQELESVSSWKIDQVRKFSQDVYSSLIKSYQSLLRFSVRHGIEYAITSDDAGILSRKLYAAFDRYPGKISVLASSFTTNLEERDLCFIYPSEHSLCRRGWHLYAAAPDNLALLNSRVCYIGSRLSEVVTWACFNGLLKSRTTCHVLSSSSSVSPLKIKLLSNDIVRVLKPRRGRVSEQALQRTEKMKGCVVILNLEQDETAFFDKSVVDLDYGSTLCCSRQRLCLIGSIDMVILNSWGELRSFAMPSGEEGVVELLATLLRVIGNSTTTADEAIDMLNDVEVCCYSDDYQDLIKYDLVSTIRQVFNCLSAANSSEYVFDVGRNTYIAKAVERRGVKINRKNVFGSDEFDISVLSRYGMRPEYSLQVPPVVERYATTGILQYFFSPVSSGCWDIYIINERNEVSTYLKYEGSRAALVNEINRFYTLQSGGKMNHLSRFNLPQYFVLSKDFSSIHPFTIRNQATE